jgi:hypothetical protein
MKGLKALFSRHISVDKTLTNNSNFKVFATCKSSISETKILEAFSKWNPTSLVYGRLSRAYFIDNQLTVPNINDPNRSLEQFSTLLKSCGRSEITLTISNDNKNLLVGNVMPQYRKLILSMFESQMFPKNHAYIGFESSEACNQVIKQFNNIKTDNSDIIVARASEPLLPLFPFVSGLQLLDVNKFQTLKNSKESRICVTFPQSVSTAYLLKTFSQWDPISIVYSVDEHARTLSRCSAHIKFESLKLYHDLKMQMALAGSNEQPNDIMMLPTMRNKQDKNDLNFIVLVTYPSSISPPQFEILFSKYKPIKYVHPPSGIVSKRYDRVFHYENVDDCQTAFEKLKNNPVLVKNNIQIKINQALLVFEMVPDSIYESVFKMNEKHTAVSVRTRQSYVYFNSSKTREDFLNDLKRSIDFQAYKSGTPRSSYEIFTTFPTTSKSNVESIFSKLKPTSIILGQNYTDVFAKQTISYPSTQSCLEAFEQFNKHEAVFKHKVSLKCSNRYLVIANGSCDSQSIYDEFLKYVRRFTHSYYIQFDSLATCDKVVEYFNGSESILVVRSKKVYRVSRKIKVSSVEQSINVPKINVGLKKGVSKSKQIMVSNKSQIGLKKGVSNSKKNVKMVSKVKSQISDPFPKSEAQDDINDSFTKTIKTLERKTVVRSLDSL